MGALQQLFLAVGASASPCVVTDSFNRADGALGTADTGQTWLVFGSFGTFLVTTNAAQYDTTGGGKNAAALNSTLSDCTVQTTVVAAKPDTGLFFRSLSDRVDGFIIRNESGTAYKGYYYNWAANTFTEIYDGTGSPTPANNDVLKAVLLGTTIKIYCNGTQLGPDITNANNQTQTYHGFYGGPDAAGDNARWDTFSVC